MQSDVATSDGKRMMSWHQLCTTRSSLPQPTDSVGPIWFQELTRLLTHGGRQFKTPLPAEDIPTPCQFVPYRLRALSDILPCPVELPAHLFPCHRTLMLFEGQPLDPTTCTLTNYSDGSDYKDKEGRRCRGFASQLTHMSGYPEYNPAEVGDILLPYTVLGTSDRITNSYVAEIYGLLAALAATPLQYSVTHCTDNQAVLSVSDHFSTDTLRQQLKVANHHEYRAIARIIAAREGVGGTTTGVKVKAHDTDTHNNRVDLLAKEAASHTPTHVGEHSTQTLFLDEIVDYFAPPVWIVTTPYTSTPTQKLTLNREVQVEENPQRPTASIAKAIQDMCLREASEATTQTSSQILQLSEQDTHNRPLLRRALRGQIHSPYHPHLYGEIARLYLSQSNLAKKELEGGTCPLCQQQILGGLYEHGIFHCNIPRLQEGRTTLRMAYTRSLLSMAPPEWWKGTPTPLPTCREITATLPPEQHQHIQTILQVSPFLAEQWHLPTVEFNAEEGKSYYLPTTQVAARTLIAMLLHVPLEAPPSLNHMYQYFSMRVAPSILPHPVWDVFQATLDKVSTTLWPEHPYLHPLTKILVTPHDDPHETHPHCTMRAHLSTPNCLTLAHLPLADPWRLSELDKVIEQRHRSHELLLLVEYIPYMKPHRLLRGGKALTKFDAFTFPKAHIRAFTHGDPLMRTPNTCSPHPVALWYVGSEAAQAARAPQLKR